MFKFKKSLSFILCFSLLFTFSACGKKEEKPKDAASYREKYKAQEVKEFVDTDGKFDYKEVDFSISNDYKIIYPKGNTENEKAAHSLADFFKDSYSLELSVSNDGAAVKEKEILIGKTSRKESKIDLKANELSVSVNGKKLVFSGGHDVMVKSAVEKFTRLAPKKDKAVTFKLETDFKATMLDGYKYVWGDEFEGLSLDRTKFTCMEHMTGSGSMLVSSDSDVLRVEDGRLKLFGIRYFDPQREGTQYKVPTSVSTVYNMNFTYGYAEIRARVPFKHGAWPSFWAKSNQSPYLDAPNSNYTIEVDIFEIFGSLTDVVPNLHKWYRKYDYDEIHNQKTGSHTQIAAKDKNKYVFEESDTLSYEYHTYGMEWTPKEISMFVDGEKYETFNITKSFDLNPDMSPFKNHPLFLILNNHLMPEDGDYVTTLVKDDELPSEYFIDYLRVYQKPGVGKLYIDEKIH